MYPDARLKKLLFLLLRSHLPLSIGRIAQEFSVSKRTIQYDVEQLEEWLVDAGFSGILRIRNRGILLAEEEKDPINEYLEKVNLKRAYTPIERKTRLLLLIALGKQRIVTEDIIQFNDVSRATVLQDLKELKRNMEPFFISIGYQPLKGRVLLGNEKNIRQFLIHYCFEENPIDIRNYALELVEKEAKELNVQVYLKEIASHLNALEKELGLHYTDEMRYLLVQISALFIERIRNGFFY